MQTLSRDTLAGFLSPHTPPGADFPTGDAMQTAGKAHGIADATGNGYDYTLAEVIHAICEWVSIADARTYRDAHATAMQTLSEGSPAPCTQCGEPGHVTAIHADAYAVRDVFTSCDACAAQYAAEWPEEDHATPTRTTT